MWYPGRLSAGCTHVHAAWRYTWQTVLEDALVLLTSTVLCPKMAVGSRSFGNVAASAGTPHFQRILIMGVFNGFMVHAHGSLVASAGLTRQPVPGSSWGHWAEHG